MAAVLGKVPTENLRQPFREHWTTFQKTRDSFSENMGQSFGEQGTAFQIENMDSLSSREHGTAFQTENKWQPFRQRTQDSLLDREHGTAFQTENMRQPFREHGAAFQAENMRQPFRQKHGTAFFTENMGQPFRHNMQQPFKLYKNFLPLPPHPLSQYFLLFCCHILHCSYQEFSTVGNLDRGQFLKKM